MKVSTTVRPPTKEMPLLDYYAQRFTYRPREAWRELIEAGYVLCNGRAVTPHTPVSAGDVLTTTLPNAQPPPANYDYTIIYEDEWLLAVNKPPDLRVHGRGPYIHSNLIHHLRHVREPAYPQAELANRLDKDTTGVVVLTKDKETVRRMNALFRDRAVEKVYTAVVHGVPQPGAAEIDAPIGQIPSPRGVYRYGCGPEAEKRKPAVTRYEVVQAWGDAFAQVRLWPRSGRTHQLRVHMAHVGHPLVGDMVYQLGDDDLLAYYAEPEAFDRPLLDRHALHCAENRFTHPWTGRPCVLSAPLPADMQALVDKLNHEINT